MRQFHTANIIENKMYVFGGGDGKSWLNDLLIFDISNLSWSGPIDTGGNQPSGRLQHSAVTYEKSVFIFGGEPDQFRQLNDLHVLDTTTLEWEQLEPQGDPPNRRVSTSGVLVGNKIIYFGGYDGVTWMNDVHMYNVECNSWSQLQTYGQKPKPRCRHTANIVKGKQFIFGGNDCEYSFNDIQVLQIGVQLPEQSLLEDFMKMKRNELFTDVTFKVGTKEIKAHRCILAARCSYFKNILTVGMRESIEKSIIISDIQAETFEKLIDYIYTEKTPYLSTIDDAIDLLIAANQYGLERLKKLCEKFLVGSI